MEKKILLVLLVSLMVAMLGISNSTETIQKITAAINYDIKLELNGETFKAKGDDGTELKPIIYNGRTYLPLRSIAEALNATVDWNPDTKVVSIVQGDPNIGIPYKDDSDDDSDDSNDDSVGLMPTPKVYASVVNGRIKVSWDKIDSSKFSGYKVVASLSNATPSYPNDGYAAFITDDSTTSFYIDGNTSYNGGDIGGKFVSGKKYYISVTALYGDVKVPGNTVAITLP